MTEPPGRDHAAVRMNIRGRAVRRCEADSEQRTDTRGVRWIRAGPYYLDAEVVMQELRRPAEQLRA